MRLSSLSVILLPSLLAVACGGGGTKKPLPVADMAMSIEADLTASDGCLQIATWPMSKVYAFSDTMHKGYVYIDGVGDKEPNAMTSTHYDELIYRWYQAGQPEPMVPHDYVFSDNDTFQQCDDCVTVNFDVDPTQPITTVSGVFYFAQAGSIHVSALDHGTETGTVTASGTDLHLVHWDYDSTTDQPDPDGKCIDVASFNFSATYDNTPTDGGIDAGSL